MTSKKDERMPAFAGMTSKKDERMPVFAGMTSKKDERMPVFAGMTSKKDERMPVFAGMPAYLLRSARFDLDEKRETLMNDHVRHEGGCLCGEIRYRVTADPKALVICHCASCRKAAGAPSLAWAIFPAEAFAFTNGEPARYRSSEMVQRSFCARCGTSIGYESSTTPDVMDVTTASLDEPDRFAPQKEIWLDEKLSWEAVDHARPRYPRSSKSSQPLP